MRVSVGELAKGTTNLAGATSGEQHVARIAALLKDDDQIVLLDFAGVESATSSYLKSLLFGFLDANPSVPSSTLRGAFPVGVRLNETVREELAYLTGIVGRQVVEGLKVRGDEVLVARLHGRLDPALEQTLASLVSRGASTATDLHADTGGGIAITAWNNRLADLYAKRLAKRRRLGKQWIYESIAREFKNG